MRTPNSALDRVRRDFRHGAPAGCYGPVFVYVSQGRASGLRYAFKWDGLILDAAGAATVVHLDPPRSGDILHHYLTQCAFVFRALAPDSPLSRGGAIRTRARWKSEACLGSGPIHGVVLHTLDADITHLVRAVPRAAMHAVMPCAADDSAPDVLPSQKCVLTPMGVADGLATVNVSWPAADAPLK